MRLFVTAFIGALTGILTLPGGFAEVKEVKKEESFSTRGTLTRIEMDQKIFFLKNEGGLELTFHASEATQVMVGQVLGSVADLQAGDSVEIDYEYSENYEKIVRSIRKYSAGVLT